MSKLLDPELDGTECSVTTCRRAADCRRTLRAQIPVHYGMTPEDADVSIEVRLCATHWHNIRGSDVTLSF